MPVDETHIEGDWSSSRQRVAEGGWHEAPDAGGEALAHAAARALGVNVNNLRNAERDASRVGVSPRRVRLGARMRASGPASGRRPPMVYRHPAPPSGNPNVWSAPGAGARLGSVVDWATHRAALGCPYRCMEPAGLALTPSTDQMNLDRERRNA